MKKGKIKVTKNGMTYFIPVTIAEERTLFGRAEMKVTPVDGTGDKWVWASRIVLE